MHHLLIYEVVDDYVNKRQPFRAEHLSLAKSFADRGELLLGGAMCNPVDRAILLFKSEKAALEFAQSDPYVANGLIREWTVRTWVTVAGAWFEPDEQA